MKKSYLLKMMLFSFLLGVILLTSQCGGPISITARDIADDITIYTFVKSDGKADIDICINAKANVANVVMSEIEGRNDFDFRITRVGDEIHLEKSLEEGEKLFNTDLTPFLIYTDNLFYEDYKINSTLFFDIQEQLGISSSDFDIPFSFCLKMPNFYTSENTNAIIDSQNYSDDKIRFYVWSCTPSIESIPTIVHFGYRVNWFLIVFVLIGVVLLVLFFRNLNQDTDTTTSIDNEFNWDLSTTSKS